MGGRGEEGREGRGERGWEGGKEGGRVDLTLCSSPNYRCAVTQHVHNIIYCKSASSIGEIFSDATHITHLPNVTPTSSLLLPSHLTLFPSPLPLFAHSSHHISPHPSPYSPTPLTTFPLTPPPIRPLLSPHFPSLLPPSPINHLKCEVW